MLIALFADIHANRQAFEACLADARARNPDGYAFLGDYVGYGADPEWVVDQVMAFARQGATAVRGNHDNAIATRDETMNVPAQIVIDWTRGELGQPARSFLSTLPLATRSGGILHIHASAWHPERWPYIFDVESASQSFAATDASITFCGHVHCPALYARSATAKITSFVPTDDVPVPMLATRRWIVVLGSVGQPRDGNPAASYALFDTRKSEIVFRRVPYDIEAAAARIRARGLPARFADRLFEGR